MASENDTKGKQLQGYSGHEVQVVRQVQVDVGYGHQRHQLTLLLVAGNQRLPLFGCKWLQSIQLNWAALHELRKYFIEHSQSVFSSVQQGCRYHKRLQANYPPKTGNKIYLLEEPVSSLCVTACLRT